MMKTNRSILPAKVMIAALMTVGVSLGMAQTVDTSTGTVLDSTTSRTVVPIPNPAPTRLTATIQPLDPSLTIRGEMVFILIGNAVSVTGRITGLEPVKRYQAVVRLPLNPLGDADKPTVVIPPSQAGTPDAGPPQAGTPAAPPPTAGKPDGEIRPGAPGAGTEGTPVPSGRAPEHPAAVTGLLTPALEVDLGTMTADAQGVTNVNATMMNKDLGAPPTGIQGCTVVIKRVPPADSREERSPVGMGVIVAADQIIPVPSGP